MRDPRNTPEGSIVSLFYFVNRARDYFYELGFDEASWNFQQDNFGRGGLGGDRVLAEAQDGNSAGNASMATPIDGQPPRLQAGIFRFATRTQDRDSAYDGTVMIHEYAHGVTNRMVGRGRARPGKYPLRSRSPPVREWRPISPR